MPNRSEALVKNALIIAFGNASVQLVSFLLLPFYTSRLSTQDFGVVDVISTYALLFVPLLTLEIGMAAFRFLIDARSDRVAKTKIITNTLQIVGLLLVAIIFLYFLVARFIHIPYANLAMLAIATAILPAVFMQFARGLDKIKIFALSSIVGGVTTVVLNVILIGPLHMGAQGMLIAGIVSNLISGIYLFMSLKLYKYIDISTRDKSLRRELLGYSTPLIPNAVSWWVINAADRTIITIFLGVASNGIYAIAYKFPTIFATLFSYFGLSWAESASVHIDSKDRDKYFSETMSASIKFFGSLACVMIACMPFAFPLLIDDAYAEAYQYIPILICASFLSATAALYGAIYIAKKQTKQIAVTTISAGILNVILSLLFIKFIGLYATALATTVAYLALTVYRHFDSKKIVAIRYQASMLVVVATFFAFVTALFYYNRLATNITCLLLSIIVAVLLNKSIVRIIKDKVFIKLKRLSPKQEEAVREETLV